MKILILLGALLTLTSCASTLESKREMGKRSGEGSQFNGIDKLQVSADTSKIKRIGPKVIRVYVHPILDAGTYTEGHFMEIEVDNGHWQKTSK